MIYFHCEQCVGVVRADDTQGGLVVACPRCGHAGVCPYRTTGRSGLEPSSTEQAEIPPVSRSGRSPARTPASPSWVRIGIALVGLSALGWGVLNLIGSQSETRADPRGGPPASAADERQQEILKAAVDHSPDPALGALYDEINTRHFDALLPAIPVVWEPRLAEVGPLAAETFTLDGMFGHIGDKAVILLNPALASDRDATRRALCHEMVHAYLHTIGDPAADHGPAFKVTLERLAAEGAFRGIAATEDERATLRAWLEWESARLHAENDDLRRESMSLAIEARDIEEARVRLSLRSAETGDPDEKAAADWTRRRDAYNSRALALREKSERSRAARATFRTEADRYELMRAYPGGTEGTR